MESYSVSFDLRTDENEHEVELNYWDSYENEASATAHSDNLEDCMVTAFEELIKNLQYSIEDKEVDDYTRDLENYVEELEKSVEALLDKNERLELRLNQEIAEKMKKKEKACTSTPCPQNIKVGVSEKKAEPTNKTTTKYTNKINSESCKRELTYSDAEKVLKLFNLL